MALYCYDAIDAKGKNKSGSFEAASEKEVRERLREQKLLATSVRAKKKKRSQTLLKGQNLLNVTIQLAQLLTAGLPLYESLVALEAQYREEEWNSVLRDLAERVKAGDALSSAMARHPRSFDTLYTAMIAAGETTGSLGAIFERLAKLLDRQLKLKKQIVTAMIYPALLGGFAFLVLILLLTFVVPSMEELFEGRSLNGFTGAVLAVSHLLQRYWPALILAGAGAGAVASWHLKTDRGRLQAHRLWMRLPLLRAALVRTAIARFTRTMGTLQEGGVPMVEALHIARRVMRNPSLEKVVDDAETKMIEGSSLSAELGKSPLIPPLVTRMLSVGEETGGIASMFHKIADLYEEEVEKTLTRLTALAQPVILLVMGGIVGIVMLAVLLPLTDITSITG